MSLVLMGAALAIGVQRIDSMSWKLDAAARDVAQRARTARALAVLKQHNVIISFDEAERAVVLHEDADNDFVRDADERVTNYHLERKIEFTRGDAPAFENYLHDASSFAGGEVTFLRNGSASEEGAVYIARRSGKRARAVVISRATGYTRIERYNGSAWHVDE